MITGFEKETEPLTELEEKVLLPIFVKGLIGKIGPGKSVTAAKISEKLKAILEGVQTASGKPVKVDGPRVRKIINHIRVNNLVPGLVATSKGYYVSRDPAEVIKYIQSLQEREAAIRAVRGSMEIYLSHLSNTQ